MQAIYLLPILLASASCRKWTPISGPMVHFSVKGNEIWGTTPANSILRWDGAQWQFVDGCTQHVAAASDGRAWVIRTDLFRDNVSRYKLDDDGFEVMSGTLHQISAADGDNAVGIYCQGGIYQWKDDAWEQLPGKATQVAMGVDKEIFSIDANQQVFQLVEGVWQNIPDKSASTIEVHNRTRVVITNYAQKVSIWNGEGWHDVVGHKCVKAGVSEDKVYCLDGTGTIYTAVA